MRVHRMCRRANVGPSACTPHGGASYVQASGRNPARMDPHSWVCRTAIFHLLRQPGARGHGLGRRTAYLATRHGLHGSQQQTAAAAAPVPFNERPQHSRGRRQPRRQPRRRWQGRAAPPHPGPPHPPRAAGSTRAGMLGYCTASYPAYGSLGNDPRGGYPAN